MKFDELDRKMRVFETAHDFSVLPGMWMVARIDGRNFTALTKERHPFEAPFDLRFRDMMLETTEHLMTSGFQVGYGYTQSDEVSLLFRLEESTFGRKLRKFNSVLAGEASAKFSLLLGDLAAFDCRIAQLPDRPHVVDYFRWRHEDAHRNALNAHCYWALRNEGLSADRATKSLLSLSVSAKNELLFQRGINFNDLPSWQKRGVGLYWESYVKESANPKSGEKTKAERRRIRRETELAKGEEYSRFILQIID